MLPFRVIFKSKDFIAVNKPPGMLVHSPARPRAGEASVVDFLLELYPEISRVGDKPGERPGVVHRLDKDTSGVLIVARTQDFFDYLKSLFQSGGVKKTYLSLVHGACAKSGVISAPVGIKPGTVKRSTRGKLKMEKKAITEYKTLRVFSHMGERFSFMELYPKTGRTHQLRVHMLSIGRPIVGDAMYGKKKNPWGLSRQFLHAKSIEFSLPGSSRIYLEADMPADLSQIIDEFSPGM